MRKVLSALVLLAVSTTCRAEGNNVLIGLFCNDIEQVKHVLDVTRDGGVTIEGAVEEINAKKVECVLVDKNPYMIVSPKLLGRHKTAIGLGYLYEAQLVGTVVGGEPKAISPPVVTYFIRIAPLPGAVEQTSL